MEDLPLGRISALVPEIAVKDLALSRSPMIMMIINKIKHLNILVVGYLHYHPQYEPYKCKILTTNFSLFIRYAIFFLFFSFYYLPSGTEKRPSDGTQKIKWPIVSNVFRKARDSSTSRASVNLQSEECQTLRQRQHRTEHIQRTGQRLKSLTQPRIELRVPGQMTGTLPTRPQQRTSVF